MCFRGRRTSSITTPTARHCSLSLRFFFFFLGRLGEGFKKKINNKWLEKKKNKMANLPYCFWTQFCLRKSLKKTTTLYILVKNHQWCCVAFFLCPVSLWTFFFFLLSKHHAYGQKENYCRNIDAPARVLFQKIKSALVIQLPTNFKLTLQNRCKPMDGDRLLYLCCCTY